MKIFTKKGILQKTILVILTVLCINFIVPTYSHADFGGALLSPVVDLFCSLGDVVINLLQRCMTGEWGSSDLDFSFNTFMVEDDEFPPEGYVQPEGTSNTTITMNIDKGQKDEFERGWLGLSNKYHIPVATYSPEQIFSGNVAGLDINFINPNTAKFGENSSAAKLQVVIAQWYVALRNLAIVGLLSVLVYVGIRIIISSSSNDKAKYKQMLMDWLIALCLLFFLHYIMSFIVTMTESIVEAIGGNGQNTITVNVQTAANTPQTFKTNLLGLARFKTQYADIGRKVTFLIFYIGLVAYTVYFTYVYLKRMLMIAFLTIIAPLVALTYPLDKISDGKAQAFNMWLKEYMFNAILQPFHLVIYMVIVGSAMDLAQNNIVYSLAALAFIIPAEKILRNMFGFNKAGAGTMSALTGFTAGSMASKFIKGGKSSSAVKGGNSVDASNENKKPRYEKTHGTDGLEKFPINKQNEVPEHKPESMGGENQNTGGEDQNAEAVRRGAQAFEEQEKERELELERNLGLEQPEESNKQLEESKNLQAQQESKNLEKERAKQRNHPIRNIVSAHGGGKRIMKNAVRTLGRGAKFTAKAAITAGGVAAGIGVGLASGHGVSGVLAGATAGKALGSRMGGAIVNAPQNIAKAGSKVAAKYRDEVDIARGNTKKNDEYKARAFMKDNATDQYIRDKWTSSHNGQAPSAKDMKSEREKVQKYANEGMTDIAQIYRARKAEEFGISESESAKIALLAQDRKIDSKVLGDEKQFKQRKEDFIQEFMDKGLSEEQATERADHILNVMKAQVGQRHNLGKGKASTKPIKPVGPTKEPKDSNVKDTTKIRTPHTSTPKVTTTKTNNQATRGSRAPRSTNPNLKNPRNRE